MAQSILDLIIRTKKTGTGEKEASSGLKGLNDGFKDITGISLTAAGALAGIGAIISSSIADTQKYALEMGDLARTWGVGVEEASKLVQIGDDLRISQSMMEQGFRFALKNGIQPNMEGIMGLAKEYQGIRDPVDRANFSMDKFGKFAGPQMQKLLEKTPAQLREMADAAARAGLVMTGPGVEAAQAYYDAMDSLNDEFTGMKLTLGTELIPVVTKAIEVTVEGVTAAIEIGKEVALIADLIHQRLSPAYAEEVELQDKVNRVIAENTYSDARDHVVDLANAQRDAAKAAGEQEAANKLVAISIIEMSQAAFANDAIQALNKAFQDGKLDEDAYRKEMEELMIVWLKMPGETTDAMLTLQGLKQQLNDGTIDAVEYSDAVERLYLKYKQLDGTTAVTTIVTRYEEEGRKGYVDPGTGAKYQAGTDQRYVTVPPGYPNDSYPVWLSSGEQFKVIPNDNRTYYNLTIHEAGRVVNPVQSFAMMKALHR